MSLYHWLGAEAERVEREYLTALKLAEEAYTNDLTDAQADE